MNRGLTRLSRVRTRSVLLRFLPTVAFAAAAFSPTAHADPIDAPFSAFGEFDWSALEFVFSDGASLSQQFATSLGGTGATPGEAAADLASNPVVLNWTAARSESIDFPGGGRAIFGFDPDTVSAAAGSTSGSVAAQVARGGAYQVTGSGTLAVRLPYTLEAESIAPDVTSTATVFLEVGGVADSRALVAIDSVDSTTGILEIELALTQGQTLLFDSTIVSDVAAVPLPAAGFLMLGALAVLGRFRRAR